MKKILFTLSLMTAVSAGAQDKIISEDFTFADKQLKYAFTQIDAVKKDKPSLVSPRTMEEGRLIMVAPGDWTSGFFPGELWYMYEYTKDTFWKQKAREFTAPIENQKYNGGTHDMGFKMYCSFGNGYRLTGDTVYRNILLQSAATLITRYKPAVGCIRSWDHGRDKWQCPVIIDNMMNLELLYWAFRETGDSTYYNIATTHARTTMKNHYRKDYSTYHVIDYDMETGKVLHKHNHQGYGHESAWARGQAWGLYGFTMCYRETKLPEFLQHAEHIANFLFTHPRMPLDKVAYWDFDAPGIPDEPRDVSAAAVMASALYELSQYVPEKAVQYKKWADTIIESLSTTYRARQDADCGFLLLHSTGAWNFERDVPLVYADYYFLEALMRKRNLEVVEAFVRIDGQNLVRPDGSRLFIKGTNLGNWLNPEGYMFGFNKTNSAHFIHEMFCQLVGPDQTAKFWKAFKDNYITRRDIEFIASTGANTIRLPFHYKLFTDEDYMGLTTAQDGFARVDSVVNWCRENGLYLILDMHDAPGGQTGDNIDDSYGYPWLFESEESQQLFCSIWKRIADYYKNEPVILGYELINEPVAPYFDNMDSLNAKLEPLHKRAVKAIREVDPNHIILIGGAQWNGNFKPFKDATYDDKLMYTCHRYGGEPTKAAIREIINFRDSVNLPMYMGEIGHNTNEWQAAFCQTMKENNIGYTFWPYKKVDGSSFMGIHRPKGWEQIVNFSEASRTSYKEIRNARPGDQEAMKRLMDQFIENCKWENCEIQKDYIRSLDLKAE